MDIIWKNYGKNTTCWSGGKIVSQLIWVLVLKQWANDVFFGNLEGLDMLNITFNNKSQIRRKTSNKRGKN